METKKHPFSYTLGAGPYKYIGFGKIIISETSGAVYLGPEMDEGCGTCAHCGHAILNIFIILTGEGKRCGVGSDCIHKLPSDGSIENATDFERELKRLKRLKAHEYRENTRLKLKETALNLVKQNTEKLSGLLVGKRNALQYCDWYLGQDRTLGGYKIFINKIQTLLNIKE